MKRSLMTILLSILPGGRGPAYYNIPVNTEGMKSAQAKLRKARAGEQPSKRKLKKRKVKE